MRIVTIEEHVSFPEMAALIKVERTPSAVAMQMMPKLSDITGERLQSMNETGITSGFFTQPPLQLALDTIGIDNIIFSVDYPFSTNQMGADFLNALPLPADQVAKIAHGNADKLLKLA
jgi:predicted TIM-barrel fold metal-dependent hydrolase